MRYIVSCILIFFFTSSLYAQDLEVKRERTFTASGLYGFMNGGADQFLEYGVQKLVVRELIYTNGEAYNVEIYEMPSPEDAFGIYSLHTFKCSRADTLGCIDCLSPYQLQAVSGNKYISVVFPSGSQAAKKGADEVLRHYASMERDMVPKIPAILMMKPPYSGNLKYLRGPISVSTASFSFSKLVEGIPYKGIWFVQKKPSKDYQALIYVADSKDIETIKAKTETENILATGEDYIFLKGTEEAEDDDFGTFGF